MHFSLLSIALASLKNRRFSACLCVLTMALSAALLLGVEHLRASARASFQSTVSGTDLIVGARTGAVPLMLYTVFHVGEATNNVSWESYQRYANNAAVAWTIPVSLGDSYQGYRVVGTTDAMFKHYRYGAKRALAFATGQAFDNVHAQAVVGSAVAAKLALRLGAGLTIAHGIGKVGFVKHAHAAQTLVGILAPTGTPIDQSVFVNLAAIEHMHEGFNGGARPSIGAKASAPSVESLISRVPLGSHAAHADHAPHDDQAAHAAPPSAITAFFVGLNVRPMALALQRQINDDKREPLLAILPTATLQQLWQLVGVAEQSLTLMSVAVVLTGLLGMMMALWATLDQRRREMAILRSVGARAVHVLTLLLLESVVLTLGGLALAALIVTAALWAIAPWLAAHYGLFLDPAWLSPRALYLLLGILAASVALACIPAIAAFRATLADGLSIRL
jgi:putative ABC transport system permease protein